MELCVIYFNMRAYLKLENKIWDVFIRFSILFQFYSKKISY